MESDLSVCSQAPPAAADVFYVDSRVISQQGPPRVSKEAILALFQFIGINPYGGLPTVRLGSRPIANASYAHMCLSIPQHRL